MEYNHSLRVSFGDDVEVTISVKPLLVTEDRGPSIEETEALDVLLTDIRHELTHMNNRTVTDRPEFAHPTSWVQNTTPLIKRIDALMEPDDAE